MRVRHEAFCPVYIAYRIHRVHLEQARVAFVKHLGDNIHRVDRGDVARAQHSYHAVLRRMLVEDCPPRFQSILTTSR